MFKNASKHNTLDKTTKYIQKDWDLTNIWREK